MRREKVVPNTLCTTSKNCDRRITTFCILSFDQKEKMPGLASAVRVLGAHLVTQRSGHLVIHLLASLTRLTISPGAIGTTHPDDRSGPSYNSSFRGKKELFRRSIAYRQVRYRQTTMTV